jgi:hypothetical protein
VRANPAVTLDKEVAHMFSSRPLVLGAAVALLVPAAASAATATAGGSYSNQQTLDFATVAKSGKSAALNVSPGKCAHGSCHTTVKSVLTLS